MKTACFAAAALFATMHPVLAGGPAAVAGDPVPVADTAPAAVHDWSGPYIGASLGRASGDLQVFPPVSLLDSTTGSIAALHAGYLFQTGRMVFGAELSYGKVSNAGIVGVATAEYQEAIDVKARVGFAAKNVLYYGVAGRSKVFLYDNPTNDFDMRGTHYGLGAELAVSDRMTVGVEYLTRDVSGPARVLPFLTGQADFNSLSLRVGLSF